MLKVKIVNKSMHGLPKYETLGSAGLDLKANLSEDIILNPLERILIPTGIYIELPNCYEGQIRARSGLAINHGITVINGIGTIDSDYRGEIKVPLINLGSKPFVIKDGDRIAQLVIAKYEKILWDEVTELKETMRNTGGFGSTGI